MKLNEMKRYTVVVGADILLTYSEVQLQFLGALYKEK
jgi:hypothetical protein